MTDYNNSGSLKKENNLTDEQKHLIELQKENKDLRMEIDILKQVALPPVLFEFRGIENR
ncbi:hypothetical protein [Erysipelothrix aquatica]|uniref:hypothetical protein n=1 Tax=Erysipelothrix aquatica TaxID=2683714 RepID=UPI00135A2684|nr:hypothetical protein [Erysipelothrix aquatica]